MRFITIALVALLISGCGAVTTGGLTQPEARAIVSVALAQAIMTPDGVAPVNPSDTHAREDCPTGGWITHGDGHKTRCPFCDPPWSNSAFQVEPTNSVNAVEVETASSSPLFQALPDLLSRSVGTVEISDSGSGSEESAPANLITTTTPEKVEPAEEPVEAQTRSSPQPAQSQDRRGLFRRRR